MLFAYFVYITYLTKFSNGILSPTEKSLPWKKKESLGKKKENKKTGPQKKERIPFCQEKKKILGEVIGIQKNSPSNQNLPYIKNEVSFYLLNCYPLNRLES